MYFPKEEMKVNKFKLVVIPKNRDYMSRYGSVTPTGAFSGDETCNPAQNKVDDLELYARYAEKMSREKEKNE